VFSFLFFPCSQFSSTLFVSVSSSLYLFLLFLFLPFCYLLCLFVLVIIRFPEMKVFYNNVRRMDGKCTDFSKVWLVSEKDVTFGQWPVMQRVSLATVSCVLFHRILHADLSMWSDAA